jgi:hypothetical protein
MMGKVAGHTPVYCPASLELQFEFSLTDITNPLLAS